MIDPRLTEAEHLQTEPDTSPIWFPIVLTLGALTWVAVFVGLWRAGVFA